MSALTEVRFDVIFSVVLVVISTRDLVAPHYLSANIWKQRNQMANISTARITIIPAPDNSVTAFAIFSRLDVPKTAGIRRDFADTVATAKVEMVTSMPQAILKTNTSPQTGR